MANDQVDITRFSRKERRRIGKQVHFKILGRNLPFIKSIHKTIKQYCQLREEEIAKDHANIPVQK